MEPASAEANVTTSRVSLADYRAKYVAGAYRAELFRDMVLGDLDAVGGDAVVLDIGCGSGFDGDARVQEFIAARAARYIGVEPDPECSVGACSELHHCAFEDAPVPPASVHVAYSVFVQEHVSDAARFWGKLWDVLVPGGVYWGFTVDARHFFRVASGLMETLRIKDWYLDRLWGRRGVTRYKNYPTHYVANSPRKIARFTANFRERDFLSLHRPGQLKNYFPARLRRVSRLLDSVTMASGLPGSILVVRLRK